MTNRVLIVFALIAFAPRVGRAEESSVKQKAAVAQTVNQAIPYLWTHGEGWIKKRGCVSCHQVPAMLWSLSLAEQNGFEVDSERLATWKDWAVTPKAFVRPDQREDLDARGTLASNIDTMNMLLLAAGSDQTGDLAWKSEFTAALIQNQEPTGAWRACGQLPAQKRPKQETTQVTVMWTLLALLRQGQLPRDRDSALAITENNQPLSTEYFAVRLLLAPHLDALDSTAIRKELIARQNEDGGWGWLSTDPSDALGTGMALYALRQTSRPKQIESTVALADQFLIQTQQEDGSWSVPGTKQKTRTKTTPTSNYWGTGWAVIGLLN